MRSTGGRAASSNGGQAHLERMTFKEPTMQQTGRKPAITTPALTQAATLP